MIRALALALAAPLVIAANPAPDFASATTPQAVAALAERGQLVKIYLFPREVGGPDDPMNVAWVPPAALRQAGYAPSVLHRNLTSRAADLVEGKH